MSAPISTTTGRAPLPSPSLRGTTEPLAPVEPTDSALLAGVRSGDESAAATLYSRHHLAALRAARAIGGWGLAEDLTSEAFIKVLGAIARGGGPTEAFRPYLVATIRHLYVNAVRRGSRELLVGDIELMDHPEGDETDGVVEHAAMVELLATLRARWREILWWTVVRDVPLGVAGAKMGLDANAAAALNFRARRGLAQAYEAARTWSAQPTGSTDLVSLGSSARLGRVPELPEVQALVDFLAERTVGLAVARVELGVVLACSRPSTRRRRRSPGGRSTASRGTASSSTSTSTACTSSSTWPAPAGCAGRTQLPDTVLRPGKGPIALRVGSPTARASTSPRPARKKRLAAYLVRDPQEVPGIARARPRPAGRRTSPARRSPTLLAGAAHADQGRCCATRTFIAGRRQRLLRRDPARREDVAVRHRRRSLDDEASTACTPRCATPSPAAVAPRRASRPRSSRTPSGPGMRVHGRTGQPCPVCGDTVREVSFADSSLQYCATCQTGGKPLADRRMSRLLK